MKIRLAALVFLIALLPVAVSVWLGVRMARDEESSVRTRLRELFEESLADIDGGVARYRESLERELSMIDRDLPSDADGIREVLRKRARLRHIFVLDTQGVLVFPDPRSAVPPSSIAPPMGAARPSSGQTDLSVHEQEFLDRTKMIWADRMLFFESASEDHEARAPAAGAKSEFRTAGERFGWYTWYWEDGLNLLFWKRRADGGVVGAELDRVRLMSDIVGLLPATSQGAASERGARIRLLDDRERILYEWGDHEPDTAARPDAARLLSPPFHAWRLEYYASPADRETRAGTSIIFNLAAGGALLVVVVGSLIFVLLRESGREFREAAQRISFVNGVSHELKTPLTNIRMYAELLEERLFDADPETRRWLGVIGEESRRLSRLVANVLSFARRDRGELRPGPRPVVPDESIAGVLRNFAPALEDAGIRVETKLRCDRVRRLDPDFLEQILGNLISNVEKYAATGGRLRISSREEGDDIIVTVEDEGPGIPAAESSRLFQPFHQADDKVARRGAGTGLGLSISRDLARSHGGELTMEPGRGGRGARFVVRLRAPEENTS